MAVRQTVGCRLLSLGQFRALGAGALIAAALKTIGARDSTSVEVVMAIVTLNVVFRLRNWWEKGARVLVS